MTAAWWVAAAAAFAGLWAAAVGLLVLTRARIWGVARRTRPRPPWHPAWRLVASGRNHADAVSLRQRPRWRLPHGHRSPPRTLPRRSGDAGGVAGR